MTDLIVCSAAAHFRTGVVVRIGVGVRYFRGILAGVCLREVRHVGVHECRELRS